MITSFYLCITSTYFLRYATYYKEKDGVVVGSPVSPIVADFYIENFVYTLHRTNSSAGYVMSMTRSSFAHMDIKPYHSS